MPDYNKHSHANYFLCSHGNSSGRYNVTTHVPLYIHGFLVSFMMVMMCCHLTIMHYNIHTKFTQLGRCLVWVTARTTNFRTGTAIMELYLCKITKTSPACIEIGQIMTFRFIN